MAAKRRRSKSEKPFLRISPKSAAGVRFHHTSSRQFWQNEAKKLNLFRAREKTKSRMQRAIGQADREDRNRPCGSRLQGHRSRLDDFDFGRKRGSVGAASAVFRVRSSSGDLARTPAALPADSMRSPALP